MNKRPNKKPSTKKPNRKKMPVKKAGVKVSNTPRTIKMVTVPELSIVKDGYNINNTFQMLYQTMGIPQSTVKQRNFWHLFSNVKNHNWPLMMQKGNYLDEFIKLVEEMPEEQFRVLFIEPKDDKPVHITETFECGCKEPCFCESTRTVRTVNKYFEHLKAARLERYDVEIQHLRYLINLQNNGKAVPPSYTSEEFWSRSDAAKLSTARNAGIQATAKVNEVKKNLDTVINEIAKNPETTVLFNESKNLDKLSDRLEDWFRKYQTEKSEIKKSEDPNTRPTLSDLVEESKARKLKAIEEDMKEQNEVDDASAVPAMSTNAMNTALKTIIQYAGVIDDVAKVTVVSKNKAGLPAFWKEVEDARNHLDAFDAFYAKKQVEFVLATRSMRTHKNYLLDSREDSNASHLEEKIKEYLKAKRNFAVVKKVMKLAYKEFDRVDPIQIDPGFLNTEIAKYTEMVRATSSPNLNDFDKLFDDMPPTREQYERAMKQRGKKPTELSPSAYTRRGSIKNPGRFRDEKETPAVVQSPSETNALEDALQEYPHDKQKIADLTKKCEEINVRPGTDKIRGSIKESQDVPELFKELQDMPNLLKARFKLQDDVKKEKTESFVNSERLEKIAEEIQTMVLKSWIDPEKDFPDLIKNGLDSGGVEKWKEKYGKKYEARKGFIKELKESREPKEKLPEESSFHRIMDFRDLFKSSGLKE